MNWLKSAQSKPMPLPFTDKVPEHLRAKGGIRVDDRMSDPVAQNEEIKYPDMQPLGEGLHGIAYLRPSQDTVVKYTTEITEYLAAKKLMQKPLECTAKVYDARVVENNILGTPSLWCIVTEKVATLDDPYVKNFISLLCNGDNDEVRSLISENKSFKKLRDDYIRLVNCLHKNGMRDDDAHEENIGYNRDGKLVLFDFGWSVESE